MEPWPPIHNDEKLRHCQNCESHVTQQFRRIFGDENGVVHLCPECATVRQLQDDAATAAVATDGGEER